MLSKMIGGGDPSSLAECWQLIYVHEGLCHLDGRSRASKKCGKRMYCILPPVQQMMFLGNGRNTKPFEAGWRLNFWQGPRSRINCQRVKLSQAGSNTATDTYWIGSVDKCVALAASDGCTVLSLHCLKKSDSLLSFRSSKNAYLECGTANLYPCK